MTGAISFKSSPKAAVESILGKIDPQLKSEYRIGMSKVCIASKLFAEKMSLMTWISDCWLLKGGN